jgi:hypothetical protein
MEKEAENAGALGGFSIWLLFSLWIFFSLQLTPPEDFLCPILFWFFVCSWALLSLGFGMLGGRALNRLLLKLSSSSSEESARNGYIGGLAVCGGIFWIFDDLILFTLTSC